MESVLCIVHSEIFTQQMMSNKYFLKQFLFLFKYLYTIKLVASKLACCRSFWTKSTHNLQSFSSVMIACITLKTKMYSMHFKTLFYDLSGVNEELEIYKQTVLLDFYVYPIISSLVIIFITHYLFQKT